MASPTSNSIAPKLAGLTSAVAGEVRLGMHDRMLYATDASLYQAEPTGVVIPADTDDAMRAIRYCGEHRIAMLPRGGGTSLAGQCTNNAVVIDLSPNCTRVLEVDKAGRACRVEPGITVDDLNEQLRSTGLFFAPDPATSRHANVGGCIGNNAAGSHSIRYGRTSESLLAVDAGLADGSRVLLDAGAPLRDPRVKQIAGELIPMLRQHADLIRERFPKTVRRNAGYALDMLVQQLDASGPDAEQLNLAHLLCGSEGTLTTTLGATLALNPIPRAKGLAVISFDSLEGAIDAVGPILETSPAAVELLDDNVIDLAAANTEYRRYVELMPAPAGGKPLRALHYVEYFSEDGLDDIEASFGRLRALFPDAAIATYTDSAAMARAWKLRKAGEPLLHGVPGNRKPITFVEDNAVPPDRLPEFVREFKRIVAEHGTKAAFYAHASVGVLHVRPMLDIHDAEDRDRLRSIAVQVASLARSLGGVMSGEHGDGRVRTPLVEDYFGREIVRLFHRVKRLFDPHNLMNPGNIIDLDGTHPRPVESMTQSLRVLPSETPVQVPDTETYFDYSDQHGFDGAVEMCNGAGVCRKKTGGTMCPSYMATLDERHSTRGRGNALRLAISGQLNRTDAGTPDFDDADTLETLNLCLSCKACKSECPSNVDIARLKAEYQAQRYRETGVPLQSRFFGSIHALNRLGTLTPGLANAANNTGIARYMLERVMHVDRRRSLPAFDKPLRRRWGRTVKATPGVRTVAVFADCFTDANEPGIGLAARTLFEACGYRVELIDPGCCGRAMISTGMLPQATAMVNRTIERMLPLLDRDDLAGIVVCEPSCLSAIRDDWLDLKLDVPRETRERLASLCALPEQFVEEHWDEHPTTPAFADPGRAVLFHGHCHQKALWGAESSSALLHRAFGDRVRVLDTGCCGMAGSFGFTTDRYDLSMQIGELALFPSLRDEPDAIVVATGTSCRHQVHDGLGRRSMHPVELLAQQVKRAS